MIAILKGLLADAGCTLVLYENEQISNIALDKSKSNDTIGLIIEPSTVLMQVSGNGVNPKYELTVEILKQVRTEDLAENNHNNLISLIAVLEKFVFLIMRSGKFNKLITSTARKITERRYDANVIGWSVSLNLKLLTNKENC